jgi:uncharacterized damage-inducible protein DinB
MLVLAAAGLQAQSGRAAPTGVRKDIIYQLNDAETKLTALVNAMPAALFTWRPNAQVRSVSEVLVHVAIENIEIPPRAGATASDTKVPANAEKTLTDRAAVLDFFRKSYAYARQSVMALPESEMDGNADYFGTPMSKRGIYITIAAHGHEHLGQLIAYARANNVKPPW